MEETDYIPSVSTEPRSEEERRSKRRSALWRLCGEPVPRLEVVFICQYILILTIIAVSLTNLSLGIDPKNLWLALLCSALGYALPNPRPSQT